MAGRAVDDRLGVDAFMPAFKRLEAVQKAIAALHYDELAKELELQDEALVKNCLLCTVRVTNKGGTEVCKGCPTLVARQRATKRIRERVRSRQSDKRG
jgi:hypothetical protein